FLPLRREDGRGRVIRHDHVTFRAVVDVADHRALEAFSLQAAHLEDQLAVAVVEDRDLGVGRLAVVDVAEAAADADDRLGQSGLAQTPAGLVHLVDALVADVAVAVIPDPVPVVVDGAELGVAVRRVVRCRPAPEIIVHRRGRLLRAVHLADAVALLVAQAARQGHFAKLAGVQVLHRLAQPAAAAALGAGLADLLVLAGRLDDAPALADVVADRLLDVDVLAVLDRPDGGQRVPVVGGGDRDDVDVLVVDHLADVLDELGHLPLLAFDGLHRLADDALVAVADGGDDAAVLAVESANVRHAAAVDADDRDAQRVAAFLFRGL